jgi:hypothetical protein
VFRIGARCGICASLVSFEQSTDVLTVVHLSVSAAQAFKQQNVTEAGAVAAASASLATFGCSLRFGLVLLAVSYSSCKLRQFKEARAVQDYSAVSTPMLVVQQEQQQPRDWLEVGWLVVFVPGIEPL